MNRTSTKFLNFTFTLVVCAATLPASADELSELYLNSSNNNSNAAIGPNILIVLDTSGSMTNSDLSFEVDSSKIFGTYDKDKIYPGPCDPNTVFRTSFSTDNNSDGVIDEKDVSISDLPSCSSFNFPISALACDKALDNGIVVDHIGEFRAKVSGNNNDYTQGSRTLNGKWYSMVSDFNGIGSLPHSDGNNYTIWRECQQEIGSHGENDTATDKFASNTGTEYGWTNDSTAKDDFTDLTRQILVTGSYLNWRKYVQTRLGAVQAALREVIDTLPAETRLGVMRFDVKISGEGSSEGGYVIKEFVELGAGTNRQDVIEQILSIEPASDGGTPNGEALLEALQLYQGGKVIFGADAHRWNIDNSIWPWHSNTTTHSNASSIAASRDPDDSTRYKSPIINECQQSAVIFLSDGLPDGDRNAWNYFRDLPNHEAYATSDCDTDTAPESCMREIAAYMANEDMAPGLTGKQVVNTYTVGFGADVAASGQAFLTEVAEHGGGTFTMANSYESLKDAFTVIFREQIAENVSLSSPAVTVNAFNRLSHEDKLYFTVFDPVLNSVHWPGNVKKYKLKKISGEFRIVDVNDQPALLDDSSSIRFDAMSYWTDTGDPRVAANGGTDGDKTELGGAAGELTDANLSNRNLYTYDGVNSALTHSSNAFDSTNSLITNTLLGLPFTSTQRVNVINYMRGQDLKDQDGDGSTSDARRAIGASPHGVPAIVTYGNDPSTATQVIYTPTNDGFLHAFDASTGQELWAFIPTEAMGNFADMYTTPSTSYVGYGLDGSVIHYTHDDGTKKEWLFFGMRRGGKSLYALDVTDKTNPKVMWRIQGGKTTGFDDLGQTWSDPETALVKTSSSDTNGTPVLVFGGGYDDATQDSTAANSGYLDDAAGNAIYMVDVEDGTKLWSAGDIGHSLNLADMKSSIVAPVAVKDKNDDGLHDMLIAADLGGRLFRFDLSADTNGITATGGMIANLGAKGNTGASNADNRKFFAKPDVVLAARDGDAYWAINIASGDRERPKSNMSDDNGKVGTVNYLFSIKEKPVFTGRGDFSDTVEITDLFDATSNGIQAGTNTMADLTAKSGWMVKLERNGEKGLSEAKTYDYRVFFTTFDPTPLNPDSCNTDPGTARLYALDLVTAGAVFDTDGDGDIDKDDREDVLTHGTVPPAITFMFIEDENGNVEATTLIGRSDDKAKLGTSDVLRRTFWHIKGTDDVEQ